MTLPAPSPAMLKGHAKPRIAPPVPARSQWRDFHALGSRIGLSLYPWQDTAARYLTALGPKSRWLYPEVAVIVGRQNGKTTLLLPLIVGRLLDGRRIMHTAQNRELPREIHDAVATLMVEHFPEQLPARHGIRYGAGQEEIRLRNGARYRIVAPTRGGARGPANDLVIVDELREMESHDFIAAAEPTLSSSANPQMLYLSNAGTETSEVLNALRDRRDLDEALAYLEWSAAEGRPADDVTGWLESNPAIGYMPGKIEYLQRKLRSYSLAGQLAIFETEHLCRWVGTLRKPLVAELAWRSCEDGELGDPDRPFVAVAMDPAGTRASAAAAWRRDDGTIAGRLLFDVTGSPINTDKLGRDMKEHFHAAGARIVGFDPLTDAVLAKHFPRTEAITGNKFANASARFVTVVESGALHWRDAAAVGNDLQWTSRKEHDESGSFQAVRANDDRPITAALAMIRAVWLASSPRPTSVRRRTAIAGF